MKTSLPTTPPEYFEKFSNNPVEIKPFNPKSKDIARKYIEIIQKLLLGYEVQIVHRGSTAFGISGKGDVEIGVYPNTEKWNLVIDKLKTLLGEPNNIEDDYVRFNTESEGFEIEIILQKGETARVDVALTEYMMNHTKLLKEYENVKSEYSYSKREYQIQKDRFLRKVIDSIPD